MSGQITRKDIITDEALRWGSEYAKLLDDAIAKNKEFVDGIIAINAENVKLRRSENQTEFLKQKNEVRLLTEKTIGTLKEQFIAETNLEKVKQEALKTEKLLLDITGKKAAAQKRSVTLTIEEKVQNEVNNRLLKQAVRENLGLVGAYEKLNKQRTDAKKKLLDLLAAENQNITAIIKAQREYDILDGKVRKADAAVGDFTKNVGNYPFANAASGLRNLIGAFGVTTGIALFAGIMKGAYDTIKQFEQGIADLKAITGASGKDLNYLKTSALELGKEVQGGAIAVVEAYKLIGSAKPELLENVKALNSVTEAAITLSQAAGMDLPAAATALTDALNQFNAPAEMAAEFVDALANGAKYGAAEIPETTEALLKFGAVARTSNISIQESVALIQLLAENGIKGAEAGTKLRNVLLKISAPDALPKEAKKVFADLGISLEFLKDKTIPIQEKLEKLKPLLKDNSNIVKIFGDENATAAINVLSHTDRLGELIPKMGEYGTATDQAETRMDTLEGKTTRLVSTYDSFILSLNNGKGTISGFFGVFVVGATNALNALIRLNTSWEELYTKAQDKGNEIGKNYYRTAGKSEKDLIEDRKKFFDEGIRLRTEIAKLEAELADINPYALNLGKSPKTYKKEIENLKGQLGQIEGAWEKARARMIELNMPTEVANTESADPAGESDADRKRRIAAEKKAIEDYIKLLKDRNASEFELAQFRFEREIYYNQLIVDDVTATNDERVDAFLMIEQLKKASLDNVLANELKVNALSLESLKTKSKAEIDAILTKTDLEAKGIIIKGKLKENATNEETKAYETYQLNLKKLDDERLKNQQKLIDSQVAIVQKGIDQELLKNDTALNQKIEKENEVFAQQILNAKGNQELLEEAENQHQNRLFEIKKEYAKKGLKLQIESLQKVLDAQLALPEKERVSAAEIIKIQNTIAKAKADFNNVDFYNTDEKNKKKITSEEEYAEKVKELALNLKDALVDFTNAVFNAKISNIDSEIQANEDTYNRLIELAGNDARQKDLLEKEREAKRIALEKKRRKAEYDAAVFNRIISLADIAIKTAQAIMAANVTIQAMNAVSLGVAGTAYGAFAIPLIYATAGIQAGAILASPLPKYKDGRKDGPAEWAWTGDGGRSEVISDPDGSNARLTPKVPTLTYLKENEIVHKSEEDYQKYVQKSLIDDFDKTANAVKKYQIEINNSGLEKEILAELKRNTRAVEKKKYPVPSSGNDNDLNYQLWRANNLKW